MATLNDLMLEYYGSGGAVEGTLQDRQLTNIKAFLDGLTIPYPPYASLSDLYRILATALTLPETTINEITRFIWLSGTVSPVDSDVWNDIGLQYFIEQV